MKKYKICVIGGDGIGPEVVNETIKLLEKTPVQFVFSDAYAGFDCYQKTGVPLPDQTIKMCKNSDATLFGAVTTPANIKDYFSPIVRLRKILGTYANLRPFFSLPIPGQVPGINFYIVRENTEDLYSGREKLIKNGAITERIITKKASEKIIDFAFKLAKERKRKKVTVVHKAPIMRLTDGLFLKCAQKISKKYKDIQYEEMLVDTCAMKLVKNTKDFDVIVTTNMFGDILSDESAALVGGLGVAASGNIGDKIALFEPVHGSAPKYKGQNRINPLATFFAACMMLDFLREIKTASKVRNAIDKTLKSGCMTKDLGGKASTTEFTEEVIKNL